MKYLISTILALSLNSLFSQNIEVNYINSYIGVSPIVRESKLVINKDDNTSHYREFFTTTKDPRTTIVGEEKMVASVMRDMDTFIVTDSDCHKVIYDDFVQKKFLIDDYEAFQKWEISDEFKMLNNFKVYKATTHFRGRKWIAWFTLEIPFPFGPWKLCGLPGLVLEASDETHKFTYNVMSVNLNSESKIVLPKPEGFKRLSIKEFTELKDDFYTNTLQSIGKDVRDSEVTRIMNLRAGIEAKFEWE